MKKVNAIDLQFFRTPFPKGSVWSILLALVVLFFGISGMVYYWELVSTGYTHGLRRGRMDALYLKLHQDEIIELVQGHLTLIS